MELFEEAKSIIDKQDKLIQIQIKLIRTMQRSLEGIELNDLLLKKQINDLRNELMNITNEYIDEKVNVREGGQ